MFLSHFTFIRGWNWRGYSLGNRQRHSRKCKEFRSHQGSLPSKLQYLHAAERKGDWISSIGSARRWGPEDRIQWQWNHLFFGFIFEGNNSKSHHHWIQSFVVESISVLSICSCTLKFLPWLAFWAPLCMMASFDVPPFWWSWPPLALAVSFYCHLSASKNRIRRREMESSLCWVQSRPRPSSFSLVSRRSCRHVEFRS